MQDCLSFLQRKFNATIEHRSVREEEVHFPLPRELRSAVTTLPRERRSADSLVTPAALGTLCRRPAMHIADLEFALVEAPARQGPPCAR